MTTNKPTELVVTQAEHRRTLSHHGQMLDAQAQCVPCKLCGGRAIISDAGTGAGYYIACANADTFKPSEGCLITERRLSGWAYNVMEWWNRLHRLASTAPASEDEVERVARALYECERKRSERADAIISAAAGKTVSVGMEPWAECWQVFHDDARAAIAALRPRSEWEEIVAWLRDMPPDYEYARVFATMIENTYTKDKDKKSTLHTAAVEERVRIANWLREDAPQWGHEALARAIERGDFKEPGE